ncbi:MAG: hypothetical protein E7619_04895 [Ruminococcaceae bacterium]|nr:hypothetical protein [Oscillospiraceae bacterium]
MTYSKVNTADRLLAVILSLLLAVSLFPAGAITVTAAETIGYGHVETVIGGTVENNGTAEIDVVITETTLQWVEGNDERAEGWWVGINMYAPDGFSADATYKSKNSPTAEYGEARPFDTYKDGDNYIGLWFPVSPESIKAFADAGYDMTVCYAFDWDANEEYEQTVNFTVVPSESIMLMKGETEVFPAYYGSATPATGGTVTGNGTAEVEVVVTETTLQWVEGNSQRAEGWWVGINMYAPEGFSSAATYKSKNSPTAEYGAARPFDTYKDGDNYIGLWFPVSPESIKAFADAGYDMTVCYTFDWNGDGGYEQNVTFTVVPSDDIVLVKNDGQIYPIDYGTVTPVTGGTVTGNGTAEVEVMVTETTLQWVESNSLRAEGWWVGINMYAPESFSAAATYKVKTGPNVDYGEAKSFDTYKDGDNYIGLWFPVSPESIEKFAAEGRNLTLTYIFDWNGDGDYEQTVVFSVVPSESIMLMKGETEVFPAYYGSATPVTGGTATGNGTAEIEVVITETTLQWVEGNSQRAEGWWVGINMYAPDGFSADATYKSKNSPTAEYGEAKSFVEKRDGENYIGLWFPVSPESIKAFADAGRNMTVCYTFDWNGDGGYEQNVTFTVVPSDSIMLMKGETEVFPAHYGSATPVTGGTATGNGTAEIEVVITETTLHWVEGNNERAEGWWVGINMYAPDGFSAAATYKSKNSPTAEYGEVRPFDTYKDGDNYIGLWFPVSPESIKAFDDAGYDMTVCYTFDWNGDGGYEQNVTFTVVPSDSIVLMKGVEQVFPVRKVSVTASGEGSVKLNGTDETSITVAKGDKVQLTVVPAEGHHVVSVIANNVPVQPDPADGSIYLLDSITEDTEISVVFAINSYSVSTDESLKDYLTFADRVDHGGEVVVSITPPVGYIVESFSCNEGAGNVSGITKENGVISFTVSEVVSAVELHVTFKEISKASFDEVNKDTESKSLRTTEELYVVNANDVITFTTDADKGIRMYNGTELIGGGETVNTVTVAPGVTVTSVQLYYKGENELYAEWHEVELNGATFRVAADEKAPEIKEFKPESEGVNGYYNSNVTVKYDIADVDDYSGIASIEYWFVCGGTESDITVIDTFTAGADKASGSITVDAIKYNSAGVELWIKVTDKAGNSETSKCELNINSTVPTVNVAISGDSTGLDGYYSVNRALTVTVTDRADTFDADNVKITANGGLAFNASSITWESNGDTHVGTYTFEADGHYVWSISYSNVAGTVGEVVEADAAKHAFDFVLDKNGPYDAVISYPTPVEVNGSTLYFKDTVTVTVTVKDDTAGIDRFVYSYTVENGASDINAGETEVVIESANIQYDGAEAIATFEIPAQFRGTVSVSAIDRAGNKIDLTDDELIVVDDRKPVVEVTYDNNVIFGDKYYQSERIATITIDEANFSVADLVDLIPGTEEAHLVITVSETLNDGTKTVTNIKPEFKLENGKYVATWTFDKDADYTLDIKYTDRSGNTAEAFETHVFTVDTVNPDVKVEFDNNNAKNENYYDAARVATVTITEHNFVTDCAIFTVNGVRLTDAVKWSHNGDVHVATVKFSGDDKYTFEVEVADLAKRASDPIEDMVFTVDNTNPTDLKISYSPTIPDSILENLTFGFYNGDVQVTIEAVDPTAGIDFFNYSYKPQGGDESEAVHGVIASDKITYANGKATASFTIPSTQDFRGSVTFTATDRAGRSTDFDGSKHVVVIDKTKPVIEVKFDNNEVFNGKYYKADRTATFIIDETNFFPEDLWELVPNTEDEYLVITVGKTLNDGTTTTTKIRPEFKLEDGKYVATWPFDEDADYTLDIKYTDRSGNPADHFETVVFTVDKIDPKLSVDYGNETPTNPGYHGKDVTVTFTIEEHNFDAKDVTLAITGKKTDGTEITGLAEKAYEAFLKNNDNWHTEGDVHTASITLDLEANYSFELGYADLASNKASLKDKLCVDKSDPYGLSVSYSTSISNMALENLTLGFYKAPVTVTVTAMDDYANIDYFTYSYTVDPDVSSVNQGKENVVIESADITYDNGKATATFEIPPQFRGKVSFTATDKAGNSSDFKDDKNVIVVDDIAPKVTVTYDNNRASNGKYFSAGRNATITIEEANFFGSADVIDKYLTITMTAVYARGGREETVLNPEFTKNGDKYTARVSFNADGAYTLKITYKDRSGNESNIYPGDSFVIDKTSPTVTVTYNNNNAKNGNYFKNTRTATITIRDENFSTSSAYVNVTVDGVAKPLGALNWNEGGDVYTTTIRFDEDADYTFDVRCNDLAGNGNGYVNYGNSVAPNAFTVDTTPPTDLAITVNGVSVMGREDSVVFDRFYSDKVVVKLSASGRISGLESLKYQKVDSVDKYSADGIWTDYDSENGISILTNEKAIVYMRAEDKAGNVSIVHSTGIVVDDKLPTGELNAPEIDIIPMAPNAYGFYNGDVDVDIKVVDPAYTGADAMLNGYYSGLRSVTYRIYTTDTGAIEEGVLLDLNEKTAGAEYDKDLLVKAWSGKITVSAEKFNSNNVFCEITAVDNSGNVRTSTTAAGALKIDITASDINVSFNNNNGDTSFAEGVYFKEDRIATVTVTERNFNPELFKLDITNTEGYIPTIGGWIEIAGTGNGDNTTHVAQVLFNVDGDYTFGVSCSDMALNEGNEASYGDSLAPLAFTVDKTLPAITVEYDNNSVNNGNYYKAQRIATITVKEHNFETGRVVISLKATDDGVDAKLPVVSEWKTEGDVHTVTVTYEADALYTFDFDYTDKAGNKAADMAEQSFYVDKTAPTLSIENIVDESANGGEGNIGFVITANDTNFDVFSPVITAVVKSENGFETKELEIGEITEIKNGKVLTVTNLDADGIYRIICAVEDKAGNVCTDALLHKADGTEYVKQYASGDAIVMFSVNRNGSAFEIDENTANVIERYFVQNVANNVVIHEINADVLDNYNVTVNGKELVKDTDYTVTAEGGNGAWMKYTYSISKDLFVTEGEYRIVVSSKDKANNDAFSDVKDATIAFVVDRTAPVVTVSGLSSGGRYQTEAQTVTVIPTDDGGMLKSLVISLVDASGKVIKELISLEGDALITALEADGGQLTFEVAEGLYQNVRVICTDRATGETEATNTYDETFTNVSVSSSVFMIFWANKPLRWGTIGGASAAAVASAVFVILRKKRKTV